MATRRYLPGLVAIAAVALVVGVHSFGASRKVSATTVVAHSEALSEADETQSPKSTTQVTVDGAVVPLDESGVSTISGSQNNSHTRISVSSDAESQPIQPAPSASPTPVVHSNTHSNTVTQSFGNTTTSGSSRTFGFSTSTSNNGISSGFSTTSVFSTGMANVYVTP